MEGFSVIGDQHRGVVASNILKLRTLREGEFPRDLFDEHAWTMLLLLFVALANNEIVSEQALIGRADVTMNAGRRWLAHLVSDGHVIDRNDGDDVILTRSATEALRKFLDQTSAFPWVVPSSGRDNANDPQEV